MSSSGAFIALMLLIGFFVGSEAAPRRLCEICGARGENHTEFDPNSAYQSNLNRLLSSLSSTETLGFRSSTAGDHDAVHGLSLCRGDVAADVCQDCVVTAGREIVQNCVRARSAMIWYDECMLRYSNESFFSTMNTDPAVIMRNAGEVQDAFDVARFMRSLGDTWDDVIRRAATDQRPPEKFATEEKNLTGLPKIYALAQCTPDITPDDCDRCLRKAAVSYYETLGGRVLMPSCNIRYESYPFYNETAAADGPPPSPGFRPNSVTDRKGKEKISSITIIAISVAIAGCVVLLLIGCYFLRRRARTKYQATEEETFGNEIKTIGSLQQLDFGTIKAATDGFSNIKKIGIGAFGSMYKGTLSHGQEIAVKRLSISSRQGVKELKNEAVLLAKLQHMNLIRLLGFSLNGDENLFVYEFLPNKNLNYFLSDPTKRRQLDWSRRYKIIEGIAQGVLYLHEDSGLKIIHRDLKPNSILLDGDMNPKISNLGLARLFSVNQTEGDTHRIAGTYGYMSPEYAMQGHFSEKSDMFSFGVLVLEIISGKKNNNFYHSDIVDDLPSYAWKLWRDGTPLELIDPTLGKSYTREEVLRCIHISLLCVQDDKADRPTMATVVHLLNNQSPPLPVPKQPTFFVRSGIGSIFSTEESELGQVSTSMHCSVNEISFAKLAAR